MALDEREMASTIECTEKTLSMFEEIEGRFKKMIEEKEALARSLGADSYQQLAAAARKGLSDEDRKKLQEAQQALAKELEEETRAAELKFRQDQASQRGTSSSKVRRMGRMI